MSSRSPKCMVYVGQVLTQAGSMPARTLSMHMLHLESSPVDSSLRGMS